MFGIETALDKLKQCQRINKDDPKNSELSLLILLIQEEEKKMKKIQKNINSIQYI